MPAKSVLKLGLLLSATAILCGVAEAVFYGGRLDENGMVQESLFLPLTFIFGAMAITAFIFAAICSVLR